LGRYVSSTTEYPTQAWKFVKYLSEAEQQQELFSNSSKIRAFGEPYSLKSLNSNLSSNPYTKALTEMSIYP
jgi:maltose-binding protein MalE